TEVADKEPVMKKIISAISTKNYKNAEQLFTPEGFIIFQDLLQYGNARILKVGDLKYYKFGELVICRSIPMSFNFKTNNRTFVEDVVFYFDKDNKISNLTFGLSRKTVDDIASNDSWGEEVRMQLMNFMENYKTAYALKRLDYIERIFSDDALIITGRITKVNNSPESQYLNSSIVKYNKQTKAEYLKKLKYSFASNEFINLRFADNIVKRSGKLNATNVYGIQIRQDYFSTNYGDTGYLFLLIDFTDSIAPKIHVRTWQPEKNPDGSIYGLSDF
ncbi:MAG: LPP20 family lipoprotein, partial [Paludibacter sp.]